MTPLKIVTLFVVAVTTWHLSLMAVAAAKPPKISVPSANDIKDPASNTKIDLFCKASGDPQPTYSWKRDGKPITEAGIVMDPVTGTLSIDAYNMLYDGFYQCLAKNEIAPGIKAVAMAPTYFVKAAFLNAWGEQATTVAPASVKAGENASLTCDDSPDHFPPGQFKWYKQDKSGGEVTLNDRITIDEKGTLHFIYTKPEDQINRQNYKCAIYVGKLNMIVLGSPKVLLVESRTPIPSIKTRRLYHSPTVEEVIGGEAVLECIFGGHPIPAVSWKNKDSEDISGGGDFTLENDNKRLRIRNLKTTMEGTYTCQGTNTVGSDSAGILLNVTSAPYLESPGKGLDTQTVPAGFDAIFSCNAVSAPGEQPPNRPTWFKNGDELTQTNTEKFVFEEEGKKLTVRNLNKATDIMCLQCNVTNSVGYKFMDGCLNVILPITITEQPPLVQRINKGDTINLTVHATTDPSMEAVMTSKWYFKNETYNQFPPYAVEDPITKTLYINTTDMEDKDYETLNGTYIKEIFHTFQRVNVSIEVILQEVKVVAPVVAAGMDLWWIALIIALLLLILVVAIICIVCYRKQQEGTYPLDKKERANDLDPEKDLADSGFHDLSRADDDMPDKKGGNYPIDIDDEPYRGEDDQDSLMEYGDIDAMKFNEDGSFIGQYSDSKPKKQNAANESTI